MQIMTVLALAEGARRGIAPAEAAFAWLALLHAKYEEPAPEDWTRLHATAIETRAAIDAEEAEEKRQEAERAEAQARQEEADREAEAERQAAHERQLEADKQAAADRLRDADQQAAAAPAKPAVDPAEKPAP